MWMISRKVLQWEMKGRFAQCDVCNKSFENNKDLVGHVKTAHEGRYSAADSDSDFNVNDSMEDCGDDCNEGNGR